MNNLITVKASKDDYPVVISFAEKFMDENCIPNFVNTAVLVTIDEIFSNIVKYGYTSEQDLVNIEIKTVEEDEGKCVILIIKDNAKSFNPLKLPPPDITSNADKRKIGGLGFYMVRRLMDSVVYSYINKENCLELKKYY